MRSGRFPAGVVYDDAVIRACLALLLILVATSCASLSSYIAAERYGDACLALKDQEGEPQDYAALRRALQRSIKAEVQIEPQSLPEGVLPVEGVQLVSIRVAMERLPPRSRIRFQLPIAREGVALYATVREADFADIEGEPMAVPEVYRRPEFEPPIRPPRLRYTRRSQPLSRRVDNVVRGWLSLFTLGAVRQHPRARDLTPSSVRALERWRRNNAAAHAAWDAEQQELEHANRTAREHAHEFNRDLEERRHAHQLAVERSVAFYRWRWAWDECSARGMDEHMDARGACTVTIPLARRRAPVRVELPGDLAVHDGSFRGCTVPLAWELGEFADPARLIEHFRTPRTLSQAGSLREPSLDSL